MARPADFDGYVADSAYPSLLHQEFQPPWIDAALSIRGVVPPRADAKDPFTLVDLGCGDAIGLILAAASHPHGRFIGVDALPDHVARGQRAIDGIGLTNITLICGGFADLLDRADASADYVTAQGVLAWISEANRTAVMDLAAHWLKPGGALCIGYNAFPGWSQIAPFQALVRATALEQPGSSGERYDAAVRQVRESGTIADDVWAWLDALLDTIDPNYFAHEYLNAHWKPCWSGEVIAELSKRDCAFVGQAGRSKLRDDLCLTAEWRTTLAKFESVSSREIAQDLLTHCWFRRDLFVKLPAYAFDDGELIDRRLASWWCLAAAGPTDVAMSGETPAGEIDFDNDAARAILKQLDDGPACLAQLSDRFAAPDLLNSIDALMIAGLVTPVDPPAPDAAITRTQDWFARNEVTIAGCATANGAMLQSATS